MFTAEYNTEFMTFKCSMQKIFLKSVRIYIAVYGSIMRA